MDPRTSASTITQCCFSTKDRQAEDKLEEEPKDRQKPPHHLQNTAIITQLI